MLLSYLSKITSCHFTGNDCDIIGVGTLEDAYKGDISFLTNQHYAHLLKTTNASAIIVNKAPEGINKSFLISDNPYLIMANIVSLFHQIKRPTFGNKATYIGIDCNISNNANIYPTSYIGNRVKIGENSVIYPGTVLDDDVKVGSDCVIFPNVSIMRGSLIGNRVRIHAGTVIGSDGYGYADDGNGKHIKIQQIGIVKIEDDVEIGSNVSIDRAAFGKTVIGKGTKIDNLVQIAHNVQIGANCLLISQVGIAGSSSLGNNVVIAGQVGISGHIKIDSGVQVGAKSGIHKSLRPGRYSGIPAMDHKKWLKVQALNKHLPEIAQKIDRLEKEINYIKGHS